MPDLQRRHVLLACHLRLLRDALRSVVERSPSLVVAGEAESGEHVLALVREYEEPVLLLDAALPPSGAEGILAHLDGRVTGARVVAFSEEPDPALLRAASHPQLFGYVTLDEPAAVLVEALEGAAAGTAGWFSRSVARRLQLARGPYAVAGLSAREREVLQLVADGHHGEAVADVLGISELTVKRHVSNAMMKTGALSRTAAVAWALRNGFIK